MLIFDIDGTLTQTTRIDGECFVAAARQVLGLALQQSWETFPNVTDSGVTATLLEELSPELRQSRAQELEDCFIGMLEEALQSRPGSFRPVPGAPQMIHSLEQEGTAFSFATGAWRRAALLKLEAAGIPERYLRATGSEAQSRREIFERAAAATRSSPSPRADRHVLIGDGIWDATTAAELGWRFVGIGHGEHGARLRELGAEAVFPDFLALDEVRQILLRD